MRQLELDSLGGLRFCGRKAMESRRRTEGAGASSIGRLGKSPLVKQAALGEQAL